METQNPEDWFATVAVRVILLVLPQGEPFRTLPADYARWKRVATGSGKTDGISGPIERGGSHTYFATNPNCQQGLLWSAQNTDGNKV